jgi:hypothetical protein
MDREGRGCAYLQNVGNIDQTHTRYKTKLHQVILQTCAIRTLRTLLEAIETSAPTNHLHNDIRVFQSIRLPYD